MRNRKWVAIWIAPIIVTVGGGLIVAWLTGLLGGGQDALPDPHIVPTSELLRPETRMKTRLYGDLDGIQPDEIIVWSEATHIDQIRPQPYLDIFSWRTGKWTRVFDGTSEAADSATKPLIVIPPPGPGPGPQLLSYLSLVDFARDGTPEIVVGILAGGAGGGPLHVSVLSMATGQVEHLFDETTTNAGELNVSAHAVTLEAGAYEPGDPSCCPSRIVTKRIGWREGTVQVLQTRYSQPKPD